MSALTAASTIPSNTACPAAELYDTRFRAILGEAAWNRLPAAVRRRFSKRLTAGEAILYSGRVAATQLSPAGRVLAAFARLIGSPLPDTSGATGSACVSVIEDQQGRGQCWTRTYARPGRFPQVVHSMKRFAGPTGLEEYVGSGIGMALDLSEDDGALVFRSRHYFVDLGVIRFRIPAMLAPGFMTIVHRDLGNEFLFELTLSHPLFGRLIHQVAYFKEVSPCHPIQ